MVNRTSAEELEREAQEATAEDAPETDDSMEADAVDDFDGPSAAAEMFDGIDPPFDGDGETLAD